MVHVPYARPVVLASLVLLLAACGSRDPAGIRLAIAPDGGGTVTVAAIEEPEVPTAEAEDVTGMVWREGAAIEIATGVFEDVGALQLADIRIEAYEAGLRVELPRGAAAEWFRRLHATPDGRQRIATAMERSLGANELHENVSLVIVVEGASTHAYLPDRVRGVQVSTKRDTATAVFPLKVLEAEGPPIVLRVDWERASGG